MRFSLRFAVLTSVLCGLIWVTPGHTDRTSVQRRAAFDIGSAVIKCTIADVDSSTGDIVEIIETVTQKVDFAEDMARSYDGNLSQEIMDEGIAALKTIKRVAADLDVQDYSAAGGAIFRSANNGRAYFVRIKQETGIPCRIVSEQQAAMLSYHAVQQVLGSSAQGLLVWDIGGGSMQMTTRHLRGELLFYLDPMASVSFKNVVIGTIQGKDISMVSTPNPVNAKEVQLALAHIKTHATTSVPPLIISRLRHSNMLVAGIGGVHYYGIPELIGKRDTVFTRDDVATALTHWTNKQDAAFDSDFADTRLTNLILVLGYMDALGIDEVHPLIINQSDGLLAAPEFW
ncbi:hypothetical protein GO013_08830 [Pseudodesulfovibrio sp. JC047]|uniref:Ppx/GppA phosphatase family protein n=1 Tax=Pseudodesulfovibrio sp. JC047 TaxID=2683199 RepID=UPI0013D31B63|nr:hypothetical protein [Pseudodesulfovibrio sp. JC047]NDV19521.1 hypothetical protein [Pseudodesulfovibrio sp. JC047]